MKRKQAMPDDKKSAPEPETEAELTRRQFFVKVGLGSIAVAGLGTTVALLAGYDVHSLVQV